MTVFVATIVSFFRSHGFTISNASNSGRSSPSNVDSELGYSFVSNSWTTGNTTERSSIYSLGEDVSGATWCGCWHWGDTAILLFSVATLLMHGIIRTVKNLTRFNKIATQGVPQMAVNKEANSLSRVYSYYSKFNLCLFYV